MRANWNADDVPDLTGTRALVTGANSGLGLETVRGLARRGAEVIMACRNLDKAERARACLRAELPEAALELRRLDLADLSSVRECSEGLHADYDRIDLLINNAGVMALPKRTTSDGFEMQIGTNHLGHFALTGLVLDLLRDTEGARIVTVASVTHRIGRIRLDDLSWQHRYNKYAAYGQSKLANLLFTYELQRRLADARARAQALACHPGYAATELVFAGPRMSGMKLATRAVNLGNRLFAQSASMGALPTLYAATADAATGGDYIGPDRVSQMRGFPVKVTSNARSHDLEVARRLWELSAELTGIRYTFC